MYLNVQSFITVILLIIVLYSAPLTKPGPNLLYIFPDQFRAHAMGFWRTPAYNNTIQGGGDPVVTPTIDSLAKESIVFTRSYSTHPVCSPYRGMLLTGAFPRQNGITYNCIDSRPDELRDDIKTISDVLHDAGYTNAYFGKTHWIRVYPYFDINSTYVGTAQPPGGNYINSHDTYIPPGIKRHNFNYWFQSIKDTHKDPLCYSNDPGAVNGKPDGQLYRPQQYSPLIEADRIIDYLKNTRNQRDTTKPFSIFWSLNPPHSPYNSTNDCDADAYNAYYKNPTINQLLLRPNVTTTIANNCVRYYFANVTGVDKQIGRVLAVLKELGLDTNTVIVFTSDHGEMMGSHDLLYKDVIYEESFNIPFLIKYSKKLLHRVERMFFTPTDVMPTLLGIMGFKDKIPSTVQGVDYSPVLCDSNNTSVKRPVSALWMFNDDAAKGIKTDRYTLRYNNNGTVSQLFDNTNDPYQMTNLTFSSLPQSDQIFLRTQLGLQLARANDLWFREKRHSNFIIYPTIPITNATSTINNTISMNIISTMFSKTVYIRLYMPESKNVVIKLYDSNGRIIKTILNENVAKGHNTFMWSGFHEGNKRAGSGVYLVECTAGQERLTNKFYYIN